MEKNNKEIELWLKKIQEEIAVLKNFLNKKHDTLSKETFIKFENLYMKLLEEFKKTDLNVNDLKILYGTLFRTIKRMKRDIENNIKFEKTDPQSYFEKLKVENRPFIPITLNLGKSEKIAKFDFDTVIDYRFEILEYSNKELCFFANQMFQHKGLFNDFNINFDVLRNLIETLCKNYNVVPYHHFSHAFSVFQLLFHCYTSSDLKNSIQKFDFFASLIAALAHDLNHKGVNNAYKIKKKSAKSLIYSEQSVLENMHSSKLFNILRDPNQDITNSIQDPIQKNYLKKCIVTFILATDMAKHNKLLEKFKKRVAVTISAAKEKDPLIEFAFDFKNPNDRINLLKIMVHACDIGNPLLPFDTYMNWSYLLAQEFNEQTMKETKKGLEVTEMLRFVDYKKYLDGQLFFSNSDLALWQVFPSSTPYTSNCNTYHLVGGFNVFGQGAFISKFITNLLPHYAIRIQAYFLFIDNWGSSDAIQVQINSQTSYTYIPVNNPQNSFSSSQCGSTSYKDNSVRADINFTHNATQFSLKLTSNLLKLASVAAWGMRELNISYFRCDITCNTCKNLYSYSCTSCYNLGILSQGICKCSDGYYLYVPTIPCIQMPCIYCSPCFSTCKTCASGTYSDCLTCLAGLFLEPSGECSVVCILPFVTDTVNMKCISPCKSNQYVDKTTRNCQTCSTSCLTCYGPLDNNCLSCSAASNTFLNYKTCSPQCPEGQYADIVHRLCLINCNSLGETEDPITGQCVPFLCDANCLTCKFPNATYCLSCNIDQVLVNTICLNLVCDSTCLTCSGFAPSQCLTCLAPRIFKNGYCASCDPSCLTCDDTTLYNCTSCLSYKLLRNGQCIDCPAPMIVYNVTCISCDPICATCNGPSSSNCLTCFSPKLLKNSQCKDLVCDLSCNTCFGFFANQCLSCFSPKILVNGSCVSCDPACATCYGTSSSNCLTCYSPKLLKVNQCLDLVCDPSCLTCNGFYANNCLSCNSSAYYLNSQCFACDQSCLTCSGGTINSCTSCVPSKLLKTGQCIACPAPMILYNNVCISCDASCATCNGPNNSNCLTCFPPQLLNVSKCANLVCDQSCQTCFGFTSKECLSCYAPKILVNKMCVPCDQSCKTCYGPNSNNCLTCYPPKLLRNSQCLDLSCDPTCLSCYYFDANNCLSCRGNYYFSNSQCFPCHETCSTCSGPSDYNCLSCASTKLINKFNQCLDLICNPSCLTCYGFEAYQCLSCDLAKVLINGSCYDCHPSCLKCSGVSSNSCTVCYETSYLTATSECKTYACEESCDDCTGPTLLDCLICMEPRIFMVDNTLCLFKSNCPDNSYWNQSANACQKSCAAPYWQLTQFKNCITDCPRVGYYSDSTIRVCLKCNDGCLICDQNLKCIKCSPGLFSDGDSCVSFCPQNKYGDSNYVCHFCHPDCSECSSYGLYQCLSCNSPKYFDGFQLTCVKECSGSQFPNYQTSRCDQCHSDCETCFGPDPNNCLSCRIAEKFLIDSTHQCVDECPDFMVVDLISKVCKTCNVSNCKFCQNQKPTICSVCDEAFFLDPSQEQQCLPMIFVNAHFLKVFDPVVYQLRFDQDWDDLFDMLSDHEKSKQILVIQIQNNVTNNGRLLMNNVNFDFMIVPDDINNRSFYLNFTFHEEFSTAQELFLFINYSRPTPTKFKLKVSNFSLNTVSYLFCRSGQYYSTLLGKCKDKISLTPVISLNYDNSQQIYLSFPDSSITSNFSLQALIVKAINISIDIRSTDTYSYNLTHTTKEFHIRIYFDQSEIGRPLFSLWLIGEKLPIWIHLNPAYDIYKKNYANLLPTYILSEKTQKAINSSSNATTVADIVTQATVLVNTILNSGSSFVVRGLMLSQLIYSLAYIAIQYPPNIVTLFKSQQSSKAFEVPPMTKAMADLQQMPEVFYIYRKSPFFSDNFGVNMIQITAILCLCIMVRLIFTKKSLKTNRLLSAVRFFYNWNFFIIYTFTNVNKLTLYASINLKYHSFETSNGQINFIVAFLSFLFVTCFTIHIFIITYNLKKYALEIEMPQKPESPKKLKITKIKTLLIEDENRNIVEVSIDNLNKGLNLIKTIKQNQVLPFEKIEEIKSDDEETPIKLVDKKKQTVIENILASPKIKPKRKKKDLDKIPTQVPLDSQKELEFFEEEKKKYLQSLKELYPEEKNVEENPKTQILLQRDITITSGSEFIEKNKDITEENIEKIDKIEKIEHFEKVDNIDKTKTFSHMNVSRTKSEDHLLTDERPIIKLTDLVKEINGPKENLNLWKHPVLRKIVSQMNKERMKNSRSFFVKLYDYIYLPVNLSDYRNLYAVLHKDIRQTCFFQTYFIGLDLLRHTIMSFILIIFLEYGLATISFLFAVNLTFLALLIKYRPIKTNFFMNFAIVNEVIIDVAFSTAVLLGILDHIDETGYVDARVNAGWVFVFAALGLLYFLIFMTVMRFLRILLINLKSFFHEAFFGKQNALERRKNTTIFLNHNKIMQNLRKIAPETLEETESKNSRENNEIDNDHRIVAVAHHRRNQNKIYPEKNKKSNNIEYSSSSNPENESSLSKEKSREDDDHEKVNNFYKMEDSDKNKMMESSKTEKSLEIISLRNIISVKEEIKEMNVNKKPAVEEKILEKSPMVIRSKKFFNDRGKTVIEHKINNKYNTRSKTQVELIAPTEEKENENHQLKLTHNTRSSNYVDKEKDDTNFKVISYEKKEISSNEIMFQPVVLRRKVFLRGKTRDNLD